MRVTLKINFDVEGLEEEELTKNTAIAAAEQAVYDYLSFVKIAGYSSDTEYVEVFVDGFGKCNVSLVEY